MDSLVNLDKNKDLVVQAIAHAYETGVIEDPGYWMMMGGVFSLLCEGKVEGKMPENFATGPTWALTPEYEEELIRQEEALSSENVVVGPW